MSRLVKQCPQCGDERTLTLEGLAQELRGLGMLKRAEDWNETWGLALAAAARERLLCNQCGAGGVVVSPARIRRCQKICTRAFFSDPARNASGTNPIASQKWFAAMSWAHQQQ